ncbi:hypothetical protein [Nocardiopsis sp. CNR-923]|uniref:hypothetical protein n=1 Tax=Nocardiopsis sp. CNR-923 TaxID=1904965 RepID=UPI0021CC6A22|nr:hypothetical protein [Nocardiopsis sp. CNR-923]
MELAAVTLLVAAIVLAVYQLELSRTFNEAVRQMVCLVEGPGCGDETWVEDQRPQEPGQYEWTGDSSNSIDNQAIGLSQAENQGWTGQEWDCLDNLCPTSPVGTTRSSTPTPARRHPRVPRRPARCDAAGVH